MKDLEIDKYFSLEAERQNNGIELICSENYPSKETREAMASILVAKYAEGFPGHRYYGGCEYIDAVETICIERAKKLFHVAFANVQPHSGSQANFAAYHALINPGDTVLSLELNDGGHLTHGSPVSFSSQMYHFVHYPLGNDGHLDYEVIRKCLDEHNPNCFLAGYSAYPYAIGFKKMRELIDEHNKHSAVHCYFMVDMAHIAGIVAVGLCENPCDYADLVTSTTHKTLRGPRGGLILTNDPEIAKRIDKTIFPGIQGGPLMHVIAAKLQCFYEAMQPEFLEYTNQIVKNAKALSESLQKEGFKIISGG